MNNEMDNNEVVSDENLNIVQPTNINNDVPATDKGIFKLSLVFSSFAILFWIGIGVIVFPEGNGNMAIGLSITLLGIGYMILCVKWMKDINEQQQQGYLRASSSFVAFAITFGVGILFYFVLTIIQVILTLTFIPDFVNSWTGIAKMSGTVLFTWIPMIISLIVSSSMKKKISMN